VKTRLGPQKADLNATLKGPVAGP